MEHNSENLVVSVFLLYLVIVSDCSFRIWLDEIRGEGRESFGDNFWAASKKFSVGLLLAWLVAVAVRVVAAADARHLGLLRERRTLGPFLGAVLLALLLERRSLHTGDT